MATTKKETVHSKALDLLSNKPNGMRFAELVREIQTAFPDYPHGVITGGVFTLDKDKDTADQVFKPARGVFKAAKYREEDATTGLGSTSTTAPPDELSSEEDFYEPFANWLTQELEECTKAVALGGNRFASKWGTPDVLGIREPKMSDIIKPPTEIISAEIKIDKAGLIVAFGQACAYKLFSHRSYIVVPVESADEDIARLDVLCRTLGLGFILFNSSNKETPDFEIRVRAARHEPDMFYVNKYMKIVENELFT